MGFFFLAMRFPFVGMGLKLVNKNSCGLLPRQAPITVDSFKLCRADIKYYGNQLTSTPCKGYTGNITNVLSSHSNADKHAGLFISDNHQRNLCLVVDDREGGGGTP